MKNRNNDQEKIIDRRHQNKPAIKRLFNKTAAALAVFAFIAAALFSGCAENRALLPANRPQVDINPYQEAVSYLYYSMAYLSELNSDLDVALEYLAQSEKYSYEPGAVLKEMAYVYSIKGDPDKAAEMVEKGLKEDPYNVDILAMAGRLRVEKEKYAEAKELFERAINIDPLCADCYFYLGVIDFKKENYDEAESFF